MLCRQMKTAEMRASEAIDKQLRADKDNVIRQIKLLLLGMFYVMLTSSSLIIT